MTDRPDRAAAIVDPASVPIALPTVDEVAALPAAQKAVVRAGILALLAASLVEPTAPRDEALKVAEAAQSLGRGEDWLRRNGPDWHDRLVREFGIGFLMQPVENGDVRYSAEGLELLKRYWRGERRAR